jgi:heavy metal sensor kinase
MKPLRLRTKLTLYYSAVLVLVLGGFAFLIFHATSSFMESGGDEDLQERASALRGYLRYEGDQLVLAPQSNDPGEAYFLHNASRYFQAYDLKDGSLVAQSQDLKLLDIDLSPEEVQALGTQPQRTEITTPAGTIRFDNSTFQAGSRLFLIRVGISTQQREAALDELRRQLFLFIPAGVVVAALVGWQMARGALRPIRDLATAASAIDIKHLRERLPVRGAGDEPDQLARAFNDMLARLEDAVTEMKQFTASISHELRTPLTALRGEAEIALLEARSVEDHRRVLVSQLEEFEKLTHMINQLLTLARAEAGEIHLTEKTVDLSALARSLADQMEPLAAAKNIFMGVDAFGAVHVRGDENWLERLILNLLDNAIKFTPEGGRVDLRVGAVDSQAVLEVCDTGPGISREAQAHIFERFYRAEPSRSKDVEGVGLGLALVKWIVEHHQGKIEVESGAGGGSCFVVRLPLDPRG